MDILYRVKKALGMKTDKSDNPDKATGLNLRLPVTMAEARLLAKLRSNRLTALEIIPEKMRREFMAIYSDRELSHVVKEVLRNPHLTSSEKRLEYLEMTISGALSTKEFGKLLLLSHKIDPSEITTEMLREVKL